MLNWPRSTWELVWELAKTDFKLRYGGSKYGYAWSLLKPLVTFAVLLAVFSHFFGQKVENYALHLLTGIVLWTYFAEGTRLGMAALVNKGHLLTRVPLSGLAMILSSSGHVTITFLLNAAVLAGFFVYFEAAVTATALGWAVFLSMALYGLILGFSLLTAPLMAWWRDLGQAWDLFLRIGFYLVPIIYPFSAVPSQYQRWLRLNPVGSIIDMAQGVLLRNEIIAANKLSWLVAGVLAAVGLGGLVWVSLRKVYIDYL